ncbi:hypothetical protein TNCV_4199911 [Trichonephila clavipes]|uniref:Uncharacterized protein n=1 Tax=Trichonephila clavipes TaxID=2585209 RepID=A0A8X7BHP6_TRICX|nr:hypothetical protein TNCV_4199911 [Trichonephila clavipes]
MEQSNKNITKRRYITKRKPKKTEKQILMMPDLDDQQFPEKDTVQPEDISNTPTVKCLENVGFELEKYVDVDKQIQQQLRKDTEYKHVIAVVKYLALRDLEFRGSEEAFVSPPNEFSETNGPLLDNCRGQSFDNTANMSGRYVAGKLRN